MSQWLAQLQKDQTSGYRSELSEETKQDIYASERAFKAKMKSPNFNKSRHTPVIKGTLQLLH